MPQQNNSYLNKDGEPLDYFVFSLTEKVGLPNYSSIDLFASIGRYVEDSEESRQEVIETVESILAKERDLVLENMGLKA